MLSHSCLSACCTSPSFSAGLLNLRAALFLCSDVSAHRSPSLTPARLWSSLVSSASVASWSVYVSKQASSQLIGVSTKSPLSHFPLAGWRHVGPPPMNVAGACRSRSTSALCMASPASVCSSCSMPPTCGDCSDPSLALASTIMSMGRFSRLTFLTLRTILLHQAGSSDGACADIHRHILPLICAFSSRMRGSEIRRQTLSLEMPVDLWNQTSTP